MMAAKPNIGRVGKWKIVSLQSSSLQACFDMVERGEVDGVSISPHTGFESNDLSILEDIPNLKGLEMGYADRIDIRPLQRLKNMQFLGVHDNNQAMDYSQFEKLENLSLSWHPKIQLPPSHAPIQSLYLWSYKPKSKSLSELPAYQKLADLELVHGNLTCLDGVERFKSLSKGEFSYMVRLQSVAALSETPIAALGLDACKKVADLETLKKCTQLKLFRLINHGKIPSLHFLNDWAALEEFRFVKTFVEDGDMSPLLRLKKAGFLNKRGYSHTPEQIDELLGMRK